MYHLICIHHFQTCAAQACVFETSALLMPGDRIIVDGLWQCLCPSIDLISLSKPFNLWCISPRPRRAQAGPILAFCSTPSRSSHQRQYRRQYVQAATLFENKANQHEAIEESRVAYLKRLATRSPWIPGAILEGSGEFSAMLNNIPTRTIFAALKELRNAEENYFSITNLVEYLVKERGERPNAALYESLIKANVSKQHGSSKVAAQLLKEVQSNNVPTTPEIYEALLEVTAVHPDYVLRAQVLHDMKNRWYHLTPNAEVSIILGLLRDAQYELALSKLEELNKIPTHVPPWLFDIFLYTFGELGFHEESFAILKHRQKVVDVAKRAPLSLNAWQFMLDVFSRDVFHPGVEYIWTRLVTPGYIHPPDGVILNVVNTASMHGDTALTMGAIHALSTRGMKLDLHHYEALIHVHVQHDDLHKALTVLCIMAKAGLVPELSSTRPIFQMLRNSPALTDKALDILDELRLQYAVPAAAFNVVLEATAIHRKFRVAFDLYRSVRQVCIKGPDLETFDILLRYCTQQKSMKFLVAEMEAFSLKPSKAIINHLVRICAMQDDYEMAFQYLQMIRSRTPANLAETWWISKDSALALLRRCIQARDPRFEHILEECRRRRMFVESDIQSLVVGTQRSGKSVGTEITGTHQTSTSSDMIDQGPCSQQRFPSPDSMFA
ncbi:hypothetical protein F5Y19DRAFT_345466 [Xylariaceae sp. FL1651]|nr:hypothetical protein F5Y19DRAFT_345466 [Xylariaceae sp. FL1651]